MPTKLPDNINSIVIQKWLSGDQRDKIATDIGISPGAVSNIVSQWKNDIGSYEADELRSFAVTLRKIGITPVECAASSRVAMILKKLEVSEDKFESFISSIYNHCYNDLGLTPERIGSYITNLTEFSQTVPFSEIPNYISQKVEEKKKLEENMQDLNAQIQKLEEQKSETQIELDRHKINKDKLQWYINIKNELEYKYGLPVDDIPKFASMVNEVKKQYGCDAQKIINELSHLDLVRDDYITYKAEIGKLKYNYSIANKEYRHVLQMLQKSNESLDVYGELYAMGFGLEELKLLHKTITDISSANNNFPTNDAIRKFFSDINKQYDGKLGFESKIGKLKIEVNELSQKKTKLHEEINAIPRMGPYVVRLLNTLESSNNNGNSSIEELELLIEELHKCGGVKAFREKLSKLTEHHEERIRRSGRKGEGEVEEKGNNKSNDEEKKIDYGEQKEKGDGEEERTVLIVATQQHNNDHVFDNGFETILNRALDQLPPNKLLLFLGILLLITKIRVVPNH
jgi:hypothetical protein